MNEKLQYATMLEMPFSTANVTVMPNKKRKKRTKKVNDESVKQELIEKVNSENPEEQALEQSLDQVNLEEQENSLMQTENIAVENEQTNTASVKKMPKKGKFKNFKVSIIAVQIAVIGALIATIFLTSAINPNSGINTFFRGAFTSSPSQVVDEREHQEFAPVIALDESEYIMENGVLTLNAVGSVYSPCDGVITSVLADENGKFTVEVEHSVNFKSRITGLDHVYGEQGAKVFSNIPVGYSLAEGATMCFTGADGSVISGYQIVDNSVVWAV